MAARTHGSRTGFVFLRDFHAGVMKSIGATVQPAEDGRTRYAVDIPNLPAADRNVPAIMRTPEPSVQWNQFPRIMVGSDDVKLALERYHPISEEYRIYAPDTRVGPTPSLISGESDPVGPDAYEVKLQAWPFDLTYTIETWHRMENWALLMIFHVMKKLPPYGKFTIEDSLKEERTYDYFYEGGPKNLTEALSMTDRGAGYALTLRVIGELDLAVPPDEPERVPTFRVPNITLNPSTPEQNMANNSQN